MSRSEKPIFYSQLSIFAAARALLRLGSRPQRDRNRRRLRLALVSENGTPTTYSACADANGNFTAFLSMTTGTIGSVVGRNDYDPFGRRITSTLPTNFCPFGFSSIYTHSETGMVYLGYCFYSPETGRWMSEDPIEEAGGINLYGFVGNGPVVFTDLNGLEKCSPQTPRRPSLGNARPRGQLLLSRPPKAPTDCSKNAYIVACVAAGSALQSTCGKIPSNTLVGLATQAAARTVAGVLTCFCVKDCDQSRHP